MKISFNIFILLLFFQANSVFSKIIKPEKIKGESQFQRFRYEQDAIFVHIGMVGYASCIEFEDDESFDKIYTTRDQNMWKIVSSGGNQLFLKPSFESKETEDVVDLNVFTNKRKYFFRLYAKEEQSINNNPLLIKFSYPGDPKTDPRESSMNNSIITYENKRTQEKKDDKNLNFNYTVSGNYSITPLKIYDDGNFTYMTFRNENRIIPGIFSVGNDGYSSMVNYKIQKNEVVIESTASVFVLRYGADTVCVFNETLKLTEDAKNPKKQKSLLRRLFN